MTKKAKPKRRRGICRKCGKEFSYKPQHSYAIRFNCDDCKKSYYGQFSL